VEGEMSVSLEAVKNVVEIVSSSVAAIGIAAGAILAWRKWGKTAPLAGRAVLSHKVVHHLLSPAQRLVHVTLEIRNAGEVTIEPDKVLTFIQRVTPLDENFAQKILLNQAPMDDVTKTEVAWPVLQERDYPIKKGHFRIDSGESDRLDCDFIVPADISAVFIYSRACLDPKDPDLSWDVTTFQRFESESRLQ
jgi:hypothetical protein